MGLLAWLRGAPLSRRRDDRFPAPERIPNHVGIIMDGNGRWAARRGLPVLAGHRAGTKALKKTIKGALELGIRQVTVFSFSTENWSRPREEVDGLMDLLGEMITTEVPELDEQGVRLVFVGRLAELPERLQERVRWGERQTEANERLTLFVALNYGGRAEVIDAVRAALDAGIDLGELTEDHISGHLYASQMSEPDLIIRTSGEMRLSNFLLWGSAYSELYFSDRLWPDFDEVELRRAVADFAGRERRYGSRPGEAG